MNSHQKNKLMGELEEWLDNSLGESRWVVDGPIQAYMRKTPIVWNGEHRSCITIAHVSVDRRHKGRGWFRTLILWCLEQDVDIVQVAHATTPGIELLLRKNGWLCDDLYPPSFYSQGRQKSVLMTNNLTKEA